MALSTDIGSKFYDWSKIYSYNALMNWVITARGKGKTYGCRRDAIKRYLKTGDTFCEFVRYKSQLANVARDWVGKLAANNEFPGYIFRTDSLHVYIAKEPGEHTVEDGEGNEIIKKDKPEWKICGYFADIYGEVNYKNMTFVKVKTIIFDEFILEPYSSVRYVPEEYKGFSNLVDTVTRERPGDRKAKIYMMANACSLANPYFSEFGITDLGKGYTKIDGGKLLIHYDDDPVYAEAKRDTLAGWLSRGHNESMLTNDFRDGGLEFIAKKPKRAKYIFALVFKSDVFAVWADYTEGVYYLTDKTPANASYVYAITRMDNAPDYKLAKRAEPRVKLLIDSYYNGSIRYETPALREGFSKIVNFYGVR